MFIYSKTILNKFLAQNISDNVLNLDSLIYVGYPTAILSLTASKRCACPLQTSESIRTDFWLFSWWNCSEREDIISQRLKNWRTRDCGRSDRETLWYFMCLSTCELYSNVLLPRGSSICWKISRINCENQFFASPRVEITHG